MKGRAWLVGEELEERYMAQRHGIFHRGRGTTHIVGDSRALMMKKMSLWKVLDEHLAKEF